MGCSMVNNITRRAFLKLASLCGAAVAGLVGLPEDARKAWWLDCALADSKAEAALPFRCDGWQYSVGHSANKDAEWWEFTLADGTYYLPVYGNL